MITGNVEETALSVAQFLGLHGTIGMVACLMGAMLDCMTTAQLSKCVGNMSMFVLMSPWMVSKSLHSPARIDPHGRQ
jgi:hypothetical protein